MCVCVCLEGGALWQRYRKCMNFDRKEKMNRQKKKEMGERKWSEVIKRIKRGKEGMMKEEVERVERNWNGKKEGRTIGK